MGANESEPRTVFLDFDETVSDQMRFNLLYVREIGRRMAARHGGDSEAWAKSAIDMMVAVEEDYVARFVGNPLNGNCEWLADFRVGSIGLLYKGMGLPVPEDAARLSLQIQREALCGCDAAFPGAPEALAAISSAGHRIHMASGQESEFLRGGMTGNGCARYIDRFFGPDLVGCAKEGPEYYERVFRAVGISPSEAIVVDDYPPAIGWALDVGATVVQMRLSSVHHFDVVPGVAAVITDHRDLPNVVMGL